MAEGDLGRDKSAGSEGRVHFGRGNKSSGFTIMEDFEANEIKRGCRASTRQELLKGSDEGGKGVKEGCRRKVDGRGWR